MEYQNTNFRYIEGRKIKGCSNPYIIFKNKYYFNASFWFNVVKGCNPSYKAEKRNVFQHINSISLVLVK